MTTTQNSLTPKMGSTTAEQLRDDAVAADAGDMLEPAGLAHLAVIDGLAALGTDGCCELYERAGRTAFIGEAKRLGVSSLGDRQKLATIIGKAVKERR